MSRNGSYWTALSLVWRLSLITALLAGAPLSAPAQTVTGTTSYTFVPSNGYGGGPVIQAADGNYYGVTASGVCTAFPPDLGPPMPICGGVFRLSPSGTYTQLHTFTGGSDGAAPAALIQGPDGNLYGVGVYGGLPFIKGTIFKVTLSGEFSVLYQFGSTNNDGGDPSSIILGADGNFYGTTDSGTIFKLTPSGVFSVLGMTPGSSPETLVQGSDGYFYGSTQPGMVSEVPGDTTNSIDCACGSVFKMDTSGNVQTLYTFNGTQGIIIRGSAISVPISHPNIVITQPIHGHDPNDLATSYAVPKALVEASDGSFYGTTPPIEVTLRRDPVDPMNPDTVVINSTIYRITSTGSLSTLYTFSSPVAPGSDGGGTIYGLVDGGDGNFYGSSGGLFSITPAGSFNNYTFTGPPVDGGGPLQFPLPTSSGTFAATTTFAIADQSGTCITCGGIVSLTPSPAIAAPVQLSFSSSTTVTNTPVTLTWQDLNAYSLTSQQCYAFLSGGSGGGTWTGKQTGSVINNAYTGSATITPTVAGMYAYALTCGGTVSGFATLTVTPLAITTPSLATGVTGSMYSATLAATSGTTPYTWSVSAGSLPVGLSLSMDGVISGTPATTGSTSFTVEVTDSEGTPVSATATLFILVLAPVTLTPTSVPGSIVNSAYSTTFVGAGGMPPYTFRVHSGTLPVGLSLDISSGILSGKPTATGTSNFSIQVADAEGSAMTVTLPYSITAGPPLAITTTSLTGGVIGSSYTTAVSASGGVTPYSWSISSGSLPGGLSINSSSGIVSGTPTTAGSSSFTVQATDAEGIPVSATAAVSIVVAPKLSVSTSTVPAGYAGSSYTATLTAAGGAAPYVWSISTGTLPGGLSLNTTSGVIAGTPATAGTSSLTVEATDAEGTPVSATAALSIIVAPELSVSTSTLPAGYAGSSYTAPLTAAGGATPYLWSISTGALPGGLSLNTTSGVISGTPTSAGTSSFTVEATDAEGTPVKATAILSVVVNPKILVTTSSLPSDSVGNAYTTPLAATGGLRPYTWSVSVGTLPAGLSLNTTTGVISGTPTTAGTSLITVQALDAEGTPVSATALLSLAIAPKLTVSTSSLPAGSVSDNYTATLAAAGGLSPYTWSVSSGTLPTGLSLSTTTGVISGTPTIAGTASLTLSVKDSENSAVTASANLSLLISPQLTFTPASALASVAVGVPYSATLTASGGNAPFTWTVSSGTVPAGLTLGSGTGIISGTPTTAGTASLTFSVTDSSVVPVKVTGSTSIVIAPALTISSTSLAGGDTTLAYSSTLAATGGIGAYTWSVASGTLPAGLTLVSNTGIISGIPTAAGSSSFTIQVNDSEGTPAKTTANLSITVVAAALIATPSSITVVRGSSQSMTVAISGFATNNITFACNNLPAYATCSFGTLTGSGSAGSVTLTVAAAIEIVSLGPSSKPALPGHARSDISVAGLFGLSLFVGMRKRRRLTTLFCLTILYFVSVALTGCGNGATPAAKGTPVGTYTVTVTATAGTQTVSLPIQITVQ